MSKDQSYQFISSNQELVEACKTLAQERVLCVDTEFHRESSYYPQFALMQVGGKNCCFLIDPTTVKDLSPLWEVLHNEKILKVFHAGRQDIEIIINESGKIPLPLFDTQVAAALLGYGQQVGFGNLVQRIVKEVLPKQESFSDWFARPLTKQQLTYAADDVIYLRPIYQHLNEQLQARGRASWLDEEQATLCDMKTYDLDPDTAFWRVKGSNRLKPAMLAVLRELGAWREREAQKRDLPRKRVLADEPLLELAKRDKLTPQTMERMRGITPGMIKRFGHAIIEAWQKGRDCESENYPRLKPRAHHTAGTDMRQELLDTLVRLKAEELEIASNILASKSDLAELASWGKAMKGDEPELACLTGWRRKLIGDVMLELLAGKVALRINPETGLPVIENCHK